MCGSLLLLCLGYLFFLRVFGVLCVFRTPNILCLSIVGKKQTDFGGLAYQFLPTAKAGGSLGALGEAIGHATVDFRAPISSRRLSSPSLVPYLCREFCAVGRVACRIVGFNVTDTCSTSPRIWLMVSSRASNTLCAFGPIS